MTQRRSDQDATDSELNQDGAATEVGTLCTDVVNPATAGGLRALFLMLQQETSGMHHSKLASMALLQLNNVLDSDIAAQDEVRKVGGLSVLSALLLSLTRPEVIDIYQLRPVVCKAIRAVVRDNPANKLALREHGLLQPLMALLRQAMDDNEQLTAVTIDTLAACLPDSRGNQDVIRGLGGVELLVDLVSQPNRSPDVHLAAVSALGSLAGSNPGIQTKVLSTPVLSVMVHLADSQPSTRMAEAIALTLGSVLRNNLSVAAGAIKAAAVPLLVKMLQTRPPCPATLAAVGVLQMLAAEDFYMQIKIASQGGAQAVVKLVAIDAAHGTALTVQALLLLSSLVAGNSSVKTLCCQQSVVPLLLSALRRSDGEHEQVMVLVATALADVCQSSQGNKNQALAMKGATEVIIELLGGLVRQGAFLGNTAAWPAAAEALLRLLGCLVEFNKTNQILVSEAGGTTLVADVIRMAASTDRPDLSHLSRQHLLGAMGAACACAANLAQDCVLNQERFAEHNDLVPALLRLLSLQDPTAALEAVRALEFLAIRTDLHNRGENRSDFEEDSIAALVNVLHTSGGGSRGAAVATASAVASTAAGGSSSSGVGGSTFATPYGATAAAAAGVAPSASAMIRKAAAILVQIVQAATALASPALPLEGLQRGSAARPLAALLSPLVSFPALAGGTSRAAPPPERLVTDNAKGLAMLKGASAEALDHKEWLQLAGQSKSVTAFGRIANSITQGPWQQLKTQVARMLFMLALKSKGNRDLIMRLERTTVTSLAQQMDNAEASAAILQELQSQAKPADAADVTARNTTAAGFASTGAGAPLSLLEQHAWVVATMAHLRPWVRHMVLDKLHVSYPHLFEAQAHAGSSFPPVQLLRELHCQARDSSATGAGGLVAPRALQLAVTFVTMVHSCKLLEELKHGLLEVVDNLSDGDYVALVVPSKGKAIELLPPVEMTTASRAFARGVFGALGSNGRKAGPTMALQCGLMGHHEQGWQDVAPQLRHLVIFCTDAVSFGRFTQKQMKEDLQAWFTAVLQDPTAGPRVPVYTVGLGSDYSCDMMAAVAGSSGAQSYSASDGVSAAISMAINHARRTVAAPPASTTNPQGLQDEAAQPLVQALRGLAARFPASVELNAKVKAPDCTPAEAEAEAEEATVYWRRQTNFLEVLVQRKS